MAGEAVRVLDGARYEFITLRVECATVVGSVARAAMRLVAQSREVRPAPQLPPLGSEPLQGALCDVLELRKRHVRGGVLTLGALAEIFAALAGGALVVHRKNADQAGLLGLRRHLDAARARTVSVVLTG